MPSVAVQPPARPGAPLSEVDTPALIVDLDAFDRNLDRMAEFAAAAGVRLRPHAKTHKSPVIALAQVARGAIGVCCQKTAEAEALAEGGIGDILISNQVVGTQKLERLAALARRVRIGVCVDDGRNVGDLASAAQTFGSQIEVLVEIDVGGERCGVAPGAAAARLAEMVERAPRLSFGGLQAYHGSAQHARTPDARREAIELAEAGVRESVAAIEAAGLSCRTIGGAGTGTFSIEANSGVWNELQPGSYIFMDADYALNRPPLETDAPSFEHALFVWTTVMSRRAGGWAVVDAGHKAAAVDSGPPTVWEKPGLRYEKPSDEHGRLIADDGARLPSLGEKLALVPGHCDPTVNLHDWYVGVRGLAAGGAYVESVWPISARGAGF